MGAAKASALGSHGKLSIPTRGSSMIRCVTPLDAVQRRALVDTRAAREAPLPSLALAAAPTSLLDHPASGALGGGGGSSAAGGTMGLAAASALDPKRRALRCVM